MLSNTENPVEFMNEMRKIETEDVTATVSSGFKLADSIYRQAMEAKPSEVATALLVKAHDEYSSKDRALLRTAAIMILQLTVTRNHYEARTKQMESQFGSVPNA